MGTMGGSTDRDDEDLNSKNDGMTTTMMTGDNNNKNIPRDINDVSWTIGKFIFFSFIFFLTNKLSRC
jgi:hypothetical protein